VPNSFSKDTLREDETLWLIKRPGECKLTNMGHFKTPPHVWHYWSTTRGQNGGKAQQLEGTVSDTMLIKVHGPNSLSKDALREEKTS
jgi:hypothetical protein